MKIKLLDHGYVELVETWGSDERIIEAARMSTDKGFNGWGPLGTCDRCEGHGVIEYDGMGGAALSQCRNCAGTGQQPGDEKLLRYLWENKHATPFEMAGAVLEIKAPIFIFREWHRHRTQSYNEMSARYTPLPDENYIPTLDRLMRRGPGFESQSKQAGVIKGAEELTEAAAWGFQRALAEAYKDDERLYQEALNSGIPKELARIHLPVGRYSKMRAAAVLRNWLAFLTLRMAPNAMWEIRSYANTVHDLLNEHFPRTLALFDEGRDDAVSQDVAG